MPDHSDKKVAFVTGANRGIGLETARGLAQAGFIVIMGCRDETNGKIAAERLRAEGLTSTTSFRFDVNHRDDHKAIAQYLETNYGRLDALINNAGIEIEGADFASDFNTTSTVSPDVLRITFETNFFAIVELTQVLLPLIQRSPAGRIVNLSSVLGSLTLHADPNSGIYHKKAFAYDASKTALNAFTIHLSQELQNTNIKVNSAHPGWVQTAMGGPDAPMPVSEGGQTSVQLATLPDDGPTGGYFHLGEPLPW